MPHSHTVLWLDHEQAHIYHYIEDNAHSKTTLTAQNPKQQEEKAAQHHFFEAIAKALEPAGEILILGPGQAKNEWIKYIHEHAKTLVPKVVGVETVDHPTDNQVLALAKKHFKALDRLLGTCPL